MLPTHLQIHDIVPETVCRTMIQVLRSSFTRTFAKVSIVTHLQMTVNNFKAVECSASSYRRQRSTKHILERFCTYLQFDKNVK